MRLYRWWFVTSLVFCGITGLIFGGSSGIAVGQSLGIDFCDAGETAGAGIEKNFNIINGNIKGLAVIDAAGKQVAGVTIDVSGVDGIMKGSNIGFAAAGNDYTGSPFSDLSFNDGVYCVPAESIVIKIKGLNDKLGYDVLVACAGDPRQDNQVNITAGKHYVRTSYNGIRSNNKLTPVNISGASTDGAGVLRIEIDSNVYCAANAIYVTAISSPKKPTVVRPAKKHYVPADKKLSQEWLSALTARGQRKVYRGEELFTIGMPVSGIASGMLYVRGDGTLARWWMFNENNTTDFRMRDPNTGYRTYRPPSRFAQGVAISAKAEGEDFVTLELNENGFDDIGFIGEYPIATIFYEGAKNKAFPLEVQGEFFSPTIPLNAKESAIPGTILRYTLKNPTNKTVDVALGGWMQHMAMPRADDSVYAKRRSRLIQNDRYAGVVMDLVPPEPVKEDKEELRKKRFDDFESPIVRADGTSVENGSFEKWTIEGNAFGSKATRGKSGCQGQFVAFSGANEKLTGKLISEPFTITEPYIGFRIGGGRRNAFSEGQMTGIQLIVNGQAVRSKTANDWRKLQLASWDVSDVKGKQARLEIIDGHVLDFVMVDDIYFTNQKPQKGKNIFPKLDPGFGEMSLTAFDPEANVSTDWISKDSFLASLEDASAAARQRQFLISDKPCSTVVSRLKLDPGQSKTVTFAITWYFPNFAMSRRSTPTEVGRMYTNWYADSDQVVDFLFSNYERLYQTTAEYRDALYLDTTLPYWFVQRSAMSSCNLASNTVEWWKNGRFYSMEGIGFCLGTCGHVWNYAQSPSRLFPELERSIRIMQDYNSEYAFNKDGRINFRGYRHDSDSFEVWGYIPDAQAGYVLKAYREHLMNADYKYLDNLWPKIKRATEYLMERDGRHGPVNGILEDLQHLTDSLGWGPNTFSGSLYLAALRASEEMALVQGDKQFAETCSNLHKTGCRWTLDNLWNGEYFIHKYSPAPKGALPKDSKGRSYGDGCLSDQVMGQNWAHQLGLGYIYPEDYITGALASVYKYNWTPDIATVYKVMTRRFILLANEGEPGMVGVTYPLGDPPNNRIGQNDDPWTGYEYQAASGMIWEGMLTEGLTIAYGVHQRYNGIKHNPWCEIEGGDHYSRSMSAWGLLLAAGGYVYDGPGGKIGFAPRMNPDDFKCFFTSAQGWGSLVQKRDKSKQTNSIEVKWGQLKTKTLLFELPEGKKLTDAGVKVEGSKINYKIKQDGKQVTLDLDNAQTVQSGQMIQVILTW